MPFGVSLPELIILLLVLLLVFGAKRLPEMGRSLGKGMREFKDSVFGHRGNVLDDHDDHDHDAAGNTRRASIRHVRARCAVQRVGNAERAGNRQLGASSSAP